MERQAKDGTVYQSVGEDSWSPVTRTAKDGTVYKKVGEDSWSPMQAAPKAAAPETSWLDTQVPVVGGTVGGHIQGALNALPVAGMVAGGIAGTPADLVAGPLGNVVGAGFGSMVGEQLKNAGEKLILGKDHSRAELYGSPLKAGVEAMSGEMGGQSIGMGVGMAARTPVGKAVIGKAGNAAAKVGELFTGVPQQEIKTFAKHAPEIEQLSGANDHNTQDIADAIRQNLNDTITAHRKGLNSQISTALEAGKNGGHVDITPVVEALEKQRASLDPSLHPEAIKDIDDLLARVKGTTKIQKNALTSYVAPNEKIAVDMAPRAGGSSKTISSNPTTELMDSVPKKYTQSHKGSVNSIEPVPVIEGAPGKPGEPTWSNGEDSVVEIPAGKQTLLETGEQLTGRPKYFASANKLHEINKFLQDQASSAYGQSAAGFQIGTKAANAAKAAAGAGRELLADVSPEIAAANTKLARLHDIEDVMNKNMLAEGKTASPLMAAGSGMNQANAKVLRQLGEETGTDVLGEAQKLAAARTFGKPGLMPIDSTGKAVGRMGLASGIGFLTGGVPGAVIAGGLTSPAALKVAIKAGRAAASESGQAVASAAVRAGLGGKLHDTSMSKDAQPDSVPENSPEMHLSKPATKGPEKWANDGVKKLIDHAPEDKDTIEKAKGAMSDPKIKTLLIQASDLKPSSKAMDAVMAKLKSKLAAGDE